jgi:hypothetical protein
MSRPESKYVKEVYSILSEVSLQNSLTTRDIEDVNNVLQKECAVVHKFEYSRHMGLRTARAWSVVATVQHRFI